MKGLVYNPVGLCVFTVLIYHAEGCKALSAMLMIVVIDDEFLPPMWGIILGVLCASLRDKCRLKMVWTPTGNFSKLKIAIIIIPDFMHE